MKKKISLLLTIYMSIILTACGKSEQATKAESLINSIGTVSLESGSSITESENYYNSLTDKQKEEVENYATLVNARAEWNNILEEETAAAVELMNENFTLSRNTCAKISYIWSEYSPTYVEYLFMSVEDAKKENALTRMNSTLVNDVYNYNCYNDILELLASHEIFTEKDNIVCKYLKDDKKEAYNNMFDAYQVVYQQATSPSGNYITYVQQVNEAITEFETAYTNYNRY